MSTTVLSIQRKTKNCFLLIYNQVDKLFKQKIWPKQKLLISCRYHLKVQQGDLFEKKFIRF